MRIVGKSRVDVRRRAWCVRSVPVAHKGHSAIRRLPVAVRTKSAGSIWSERVVLEVIVAPLAVTYIASVGKAR
jgi:hypothetical protein